MLCKPSNILSRQEDKGYLTSCMHLSPQGYPKSVPLDILSVSEGSPRSGLPSKSKLTVFSLSAQNDKRSFLNSLSPKLSKGISRRFWVMCYDESRRNACGGSRAAPSIVVRRPLAPTSGLPHFWAPPTPGRAPQPPAEAP